MKKYCHILVLALMPLALINGCAKLVETPLSKNQVESPAVFADSLSANTALLGAYFTLGTASGASTTYFKNLSVYVGDLNYTASAVAVQQFQIGNLTPENTQVSALWISLYNVIYQCNAVIENVAPSKSLSDKAKETITAEAKFIRAYAYFYLYYTFQRIPLILKTDVEANSRAQPSEMTLILKQIHDDLEAAIQGLPSTYIGAGRVRANKFTAKALLARLYLYQSNWERAEKEANDIITAIDYELPKLEDVFLTTSKEAIWQFWNTNGFIADATATIPSSATTLPTYTINDDLLNAFEINDARKTQWMKANTVTTAGIAKVYFYAAKYKNRATNTSRAEYSTAVRLAEIHLIRAEALAQQQKITAAVADLNAIRKRAGLANKSENIGQLECLQAIYKERQIELFAEFGLRFFDLKRLAMLNNVIKPLKPDWKEAGANLPIPLNEILYNKNLSQNEGY